MRYLHTMVRVFDLDKSLHFYCALLGMKVTRRKDVPQGKFSLLFLSTSEHEEPMLELTWNWEEPSPYSTGRNFGHIAFEVEDIYALCAKLEENGQIIHRPPRDGRMAFVKSPDGVSIELLQKGEPLPVQEPWMSMKNTGDW